MNGYKVAPRATSFCAFLRTHRAFNLDVTVRELASSGAPTAVPPCTLVQSSIMVYSWNAPSGTSSCGAQYQTRSRQIADQSGLLTNTEYVLLFNCHDRWQASMSTGYITGL